MSHELEEGLTLNLDFSKIAKVAANIREEKDNVIPVAVQNADTKEVILIAYTNRQAMELTFKTRTLTLWLVYLVRPRRGAICHTKNKAGQPRNCYYRAVNLDDGVTLTNLDP